MRAPSAGNQVDRDAGLARYTAQCLKWTALLHLLEVLAVFVPRMIVAPFPLEIQTNRPTFSEAERERLPGVPGIQINVLAICPNALPPSYPAWGALFTIAKAQVIHA